MVAMEAWRRVDEVEMTESWFNADALRAFHVKLIQLAF